MVSKSRLEFENPETGRAVEHAFVFGAGPIVVRPDDRRGLILASNCREYMSEFCTQVTKKTDKISTKRPKNLPLANTLTHELIKAGGVLPLPTSAMYSVYSCNDFIRRAYPKWRNTSEIVQRHYHQKALREVAEESGCEVFTLNMNLSPSFAEDIIENGGSAHLLERLTLKLRRSLGRKPPIWLVLEAAVTETNGNPLRHGKGPLNRSQGVLHAHGAIALKKAEIPTLKRVVRQLNHSDNAVFKSNEFVSVVIKDDVNWVEYCNKFRFLNQILLNGLRNYSCSKRLSGLAAQLYEQDRREHQELSFHQPEYR